MACVLSDGLYIGRKSHSIDAISALLLGDQRVVFDIDMEVDKQTLYQLLENVNLGSGIRHGESKRQFADRLIGVRDLLHRLPDDFLNGKEASIMDAITVFRKETKRNRQLGSSSTKIFDMPNPDEFASLDTSGRLFKFFCSVSGVSIFHGWQCCLDFPAALYDRAHHRVVGPSSFLFCRLAFPVGPFWVK